MTRIKRTDEIGKSDNVMYRYNYSGNNITDPVEVIAFEIGELGNIDIPDYCLENYGDKMRPNVYNEIENAIGLIEDGDMDEDMAEHIAKRIVSEMERIWHISIKRVVWLADYDTVVDMYCENGDTNNIEAVETSDYILSDLEGDGILFAYSKDG